MRVCIKECGSFIYADKLGYVHSDLSLHCVQSKWLRIVNRFKNKILKSYENKVLSIFLRGSVASGIATAHVADIDFVVITKKPIQKAEKEEIQIIADSLLQKNRFVRKMDIKIYSIKQIIKSRERIYIKIGAICVYGRDIRNLIPDLKVGKDIAITLNQLKGNIHKFLVDLKRGKFKNEIESTAIKLAMMKRTLRSGLELVSTRAWCHTRDVYQCWVIFSRFYPRYAKQMHKALGYVINPPHDVNEIKKFIPLMRFMLKEARKYKIV